MRPCPYCESLAPIKQRYDYQGNAAGIMCDACWATSGLNSDIDTVQITLEPPGGGPVANTYKVTLREPQRPGIATQMALDILMENVPGLYSYDILVWDESGRALAADPDYEIHSNPNAGTIEEVN